MRRGSAGRIESKTGEDERMKRRRRSIPKWPCTVLTVLLVIVWVGSAWWFVRVSALPTFGFSVGAGRVQLYWCTPWSLLPERGIETFRTRMPATMHWQFGLERGLLSSLNMTDTRVFIPLWFVTLLFGLPAAATWHRDRRRAPSVCVKCGYDLRGNTSGVCPECGGGL